jgi:nucleoside-diphosphate-sugar epimerase
MLASVLGMNMLLEKSVPVAPLTEDLGKSQIIIEKPLAFVTGVKDGVGKSLAQLLVSRGWQVGAVVRNCERSRRTVPEEVKLFQGSISDRISFRRCLSDFVKHCRGFGVHGPLTVFHCHLLPEGFAEDARAFSLVNVDGTRNVFAAALECQADRVVYKSTIDTFNGSDTGVLVETSRVLREGNTPYERSVHKAELLCDEFAARGLPLVVLNCAPLYGPHLAASAVNDFIAHMVNAEQVPSTPGGVAILDRESCAEALLQAAADGQVGERYLVADGHVRLDDFALTIVKARSKLYPASSSTRTRTALPKQASGSLGAKLKQMVTVSRKEEAVSLEPTFPLDVSKAVEHLGFRPQALETGIAAMVKFLVQDGSARPVLRPDDSASSCECCSIEFSFTRRRHHCRACGHVFCGHCCSTKISLTRLGYSDPVRVCNDCKQSEQTGQSSSLLDLGSMIQKDS